VLTDVSEERIASVFRVEETRRKSKNLGVILDISVLAPAHAGSSLTDFLLSSTLKMGEIHSSETSVNTISTRRHIPEDCFLQKENSCYGCIFLITNCMFDTLKIKGDICTKVVKSKSGEVSKTINNIYIS
jgi:hypothetical protein